MRSSGSSLMFSGVFIAEEVDGLGHKWSEEIAHVPEIYLFH
jgi:hypothetical protein